jgi:hypothetical protein
MNASIVNFAPVSSSKVRFFNALVSYAEKASDAEGIKADIDAFLADNGHMMAEVNIENSVLDAAKVARLTPTMTRKRIIVTKLVRLVELTAKDNAELVASTFAHYLPTPSTEETSNEKTSKTEETSSTEVSTETAEEASTEEA